VRTTYGSPIYADHVPSASDILVETLERNGAVVLAKSNTPEFGAGANTFNPVFGKTLNPWNRALTPGGSSGGSAVALATGMAWLATGSDLGGSLRTPASFCSVVGLRPSPGRVAHGPFHSPPHGLAFDDLFVDGPMARTVADMALMLDAMLGEDPRDPLSLPAPGRAFAESARRPAAPRQVAWSPDLGITPVDPEVAQLCRDAARRLERLGSALEQAHPDFSHASETFQSLRALLFAGELGALLDGERQRMKPDVVWNIEKGLAQSGADIALAQRRRTALHAEVAQFFRRFDLLVCPAAIVPPFPVDQRYVSEVAGHRFDNYVDWISITYAITLTGCPALSLPCGFTRSGLPVGLQMVAPPRGEAVLIAAAAALEAELALAGRVPIDPIGGAVEPAATVQSP
jgi:amidase